MRLSVDIYGIREAVGEEKAAYMLRKAGFDCYDFHCYTNGRHGNMLNDAYRENARAMRCCADAQGLICNQAHAPFVFRREANRIDTADPVYRELVRAIEFAAILGADNIVFHPVFSLPLPPDFTDYNRKFFKSLEPYCEKFGIRIAVENLYGNDGNHLVGILQTPERMVEFIKVLDSPWFGACVDIGHIGLSAEDPATYLAGMNPQLMRAIHVHDNDFVKDSHRIPYAGSFDWERIAAALASIGYRGDFTFEILGYLKKFDPPLLPSALEHAAEIGRHLIRKIERYTENSDNE